MIPMNSLLSVNLTFKHTCGFQLPLKPLVWNLAFKHTLHGFGATIELVCNLTTSFKHTLHSFRATMPTGLFNDTIM